MNKLQWFRKWEDALDDAWHEGEAPDGQVITQNTFDEFCNDMFEQWKESKDDY